MTVQSTECEQLRQKFRGALLGVAIGDALGRPFEGTRAVGFIHRDQILEVGRPLTYTDDTAMTIGMAESLIERRGFDGARMAMDFANHYRAEPWRGYGSGPPRVFRLIEQGVPWDEAGRSLFGGAGSFGNGAAMRVAPAALLAFRDLGRAGWLGRQTGTTTHTHELALEGAVLQACAIALLLQHPAGAPIEQLKLLDSLRQQVQSPVYRDKLAAIEQLLPDAEYDDVLERIGHGVEAQEAVPAALYSFLRSANSFPDVIASAINLGGDTDTIASMAGALAGAYLGESAIPLEWREQVEAGTELEVLADDLLNLALEQG